MGVAVEPGESDAGRENIAEGTAEGEQAVADSVFTQRIIRAIMGVSDGRLGAQVFRELESVSQMAAAQTLRGLRQADRKTLGRNSRLQQTGEQGSLRLCRRTQQQDPGSSTTCLWLERRGISALEGLNLYAGGNIN